jgi:hypothetical protein
VCGSYTIAEVITERRHALNWDQVPSFFQCVCVSERGGRERKRERKRERALAQVA